MTTTSSLITMRGSLFDLLDQAAELVDVPVGYGWLASQPDEWVMVGGTADWDQEWATLSLEHRRDERYTLDLIVETLLPNMDQREADVRADELLDIVGGLLLPRPTIVLDHGQIIDLQLRVNALRGGPWEQTHFARIEAGVRLHVRL